MLEQSNEAHLRQLAAETILGTSGLTDNLTDEEAKPLIAWALKQAEAAVLPITAASQTVDMLPQDKVGGLVAERMGPVRRVMKAINSLTADRHGLSSEEVADELAYIQDLAQKLPSPPLLTAADITVDDLPSRQAGLDNSAFVSAILSMLSGEPSSQPQEPEPGVGAGGLVAAVSSEPLSQLQEPEQGAAAPTWWRRWTANLRRNCRKSNS